MIVFAAITPHSPLLLSTIGKDKQKELRSTLTAFMTLRAGLERAKPDTVVVISPHSTALPDAVVLNLADVYRSDLTAFGDLETKVQFRADVVLIDRLQRALRKGDRPVTLLSVPDIDYGAAVPLVLLGVANGSPLISVFPGSELNFKTHFTIGEQMKEVLLEDERRIAIIASTNLSHRLSSDTPAGFSPRGKEFDDLVIRALESKNTKSLLSASPELVQEAGQCGFRSTILLLGVLAGSSSTPRILAYEHPFGVGYLTVQFEVT